MNGCEKILIIDDNKHDRFFLTAALNANGITEVDGVSSGEGAVDYVSHLKGEDLPNLIFLDLSLKEMTGLELLRWVRQNSVFDHIPIVILSASRNEEDKSTAIALKAKAFYTKPTNLTDLDDIVKKALQHCREQSLYLDIREQSRD